MVRRKEVREREKEWNVDKSKCKDLSCFLDIHNRNSNGYFPHPGQTILNNESASITECWNCVMSTKK